MRRMSAAQAFRALALVYRKINRIGFSLEKSRALALSLEAIAELDPPGEAGAVLAGMEAQGDSGWSEEMAAHLRRGGVKPGPLADAARVWEAVRAGAEQRRHLHARYVTIAGTYKKGLENIIARMAEEQQGSGEPPVRAAKVGAPLPRSSP